MRSGFVEGRHYGRLLAVDADARPVLELGPADEAIFPRSANKPLQAYGMLRCGLADVIGDDDRLLAVAAASHSGEPVHVELVGELLRRARLSESALANTPAFPLDDTAATTHLRNGGAADRLHQNCSGKHAAMLASCVAAGWATEGYLAPGHPLQQALRAAAAELAGEPVAAVGVDGCGAPLFALTLRGLLRAYRALVLGAGPARRVADAMRAHPYVVGGRGRAVTTLMSGVPGCLAKDGAEGVFAAVLADGAGCAVKIEDGAARAAVPVAVAALRALGAHAPALEALSVTPVLGHGARVGEVRPVVLP